MGGADVHEGKHIVLEGGTKWFLSRLVHGVYWNRQAEQEERRRGNLEDAERG